MLERGEMLPRSLPAQVSKVLMDGIKAKKAPARQAGEEEQKGNEGPGRRAGLRRAIARF